MQKRPRTTYYERNCKGVNFVAGTGPANNIPPGIPDRPALPSNFGNSIDDRNPRPGATDTQGN